MIEPCKVCTRPTCGLEQIEGFGKGFSVLKQLHVYMYVYIGAFCHCKLKTAELCLYYVERFVLLNSNLVKLLIDSQSLYTGTWQRKFNTHSRKAIAVQFGVLYTCTSSSTLYSNVTFINFCCSTLQNNACSNQQNKCTNTCGYHDNRVYICEYIST